MNLNNIKHFFANTFLYLLIVVLLYYLYSPLNNNPNNKTSSAIQFVYQQF